ncbi:uncharacterized protein LOC143036365 isoform X2 [Oratosquilla oratoria]|uniref:uncharacterized protein LOC143036365 isoform X2 n=1 Tax=Oratosquilla oratoria TaxID=337810 RepID=UPI003F764AEF
MAEAVRVKTRTPKVRYRGVVKRLSRLIRHIVHHVTDHWQNFITYHSNITNGEVDQDFLVRLQLIDATVYTARPHLMITHLVGPHPLSLDQITAIGWKWPKSLQCTPITWTEHTRGRVV